MYPGGAQKLCIDFHCFVVLLVSLSRILTVVYYELIKEEVLEVLLGIRMEMLFGISLGQLFLRMPMKLKFLLIIRCHELVRM